MKTTKNSLRQLASECGYRLVAGLSWENMAGVAPCGTGFYGLEIRPGYVKTFKTGRKCEAFMRSVLADWADLSA